ncbi:bifunctional tRNA pseudouridine(32) synthase/23S rRNA pseudouridine(746) synthase RluA [Polycladidibacter hongkongensis]|uniref:bifunctional tRNA pseudouridine(32) synthase/23S rRNA pseudouridine(746) synthase RluA n=1 Tax=Polycladidibacter hongkongensis TaxID=1647556 RepID=UPI00083745D3|nr:bifunctional tRNA pseudouridine(32) synthase/23S rRNA pseudouridine(746) synthase RluA [Pseudovibrio hongkongensis]
MTSQAPAFIYTPPKEPFLDVLYHDADLLVLNKPSGLLSVPGKAAEHKDCLETRAQQRFPTATTVHRLDMDTSGVMIMALNKAAHRHLGLQFERRYTKKQYLARVWGQVALESGVVDLPLRCDWPNRPKQMVDHELGKPAQTHFTVLSRDAQSSVMLLKPVTGRSHQLRVHMLELGHPILGDRFYAQGEALAAADRLQLHAHVLELRHPIGGADLRFVAACPFLAEFG